jgi:hypothetical protein
LIIAEVREHDGEREMVRRFRKKPHQEKYFVPFQAAQIINS